MSLVLTVDRTKVSVCPKPFEPQHDKINTMASEHREFSSQPGNEPSLIRDFAVHSVGNQGPIVSSCGQRRL